MERLNWALLGVMGIITALGLSTSSGAGKSNTALLDTPEMVIECAPIDYQFPSTVAAPVELATNVPATSHAGCSACQAKQAAFANQTATTSKNGFDDLIKLIQDNVKPTTGNLVSGDACPGNCQATGVCCDKSLPKSDTAVVTTETPVCNGIADGRTVGTKLVICGDGTCKLVPGETVSADCPLTKAAAMIENLTKNYVCEGGECLTKPGHGTLTITAVEPASTQPEGLSNLLAAAEAIKTEQPAGTIATQDLTANEITITTDHVLTTGEGLKAIEATGKNAPATVTTVQPALKIELRATEAKPAVDNSRAAARAAKLAQLEAKMAQPWTLAFNETSLTQAVAAIQEKFGVPVLLDLRVLEESNIDTATPLTADQQPEIEAGEFLQGYLRNHNLTWIIPASNDRILITTMEKAAQSQLTRIFDVSGLVDENQVNEELLEKITQFVETSSWARNGGQGQVALLKKGNTVKLIATNDYWTLRRLKEYLEDLRIGLDDANPRTAMVVDPKLPSLRTYELPLYFSHDSKAEEQNQKLTATKLSLQQVLKSTPGFSEETFETLVFGNRTVLMTKQLPAVHKEIERVFEQLKQHPPVGLHSMIPVVGRTEQQKSGFGGRVLSGFFSVAP